jgi:hypothetical protein
MASQINWQIRSATLIGKKWSALDFCEKFLCLENMAYPVFCMYHSHFAENGGYFTSTSFEDAVLQANGPTTFYDSVS